MAAEGSENVNLGDSSDVIAKQERRRIMKPITERLRRERINHNLNELKMLVLTALNEDVSQYTRMEKADVLEMAVRYIQHIQKKKSLGKDNYLPFKDRSPKFSRTASSRVESTESQEGPTEHAPEVKAKPLACDAIPLSSSASTTAQTSLNAAQNNDNQLVASVISASVIRPISTIINNEASSPSPSTPHLESSSESKSSPKKRPSSTQSRRSFNSPCKSKSSPLKMIDKNTLRAEDGRIESQAPTPKKTRLPGMECFVQDSGYWNASPVNKENYYGTGNSFENQLAVFYGNQLFSPVWRPWH